MVMVDFVKGQMGGDEVILLDGRQIPKRYRPSSARSVLMTPSLRGREVGLLYPPLNGGDIRVKIYELSSRGCIPMCGGLTQVLGKALSETTLARRFHIRLRRPRSVVMLETDSGVIPIHIAFRGGRVAKIITEMGNYVEKCYEWGRQEIDFRGVPVERLGLFYFVDLDRLAEKYPGVDFTRNNPASLGFFEDLRMEIEAERIYGVVKGVSVPGHMEAAFRFVPPDTLALGGEEFACGTGSTTAAVNELLHSRLPIDGRGHGHLSLRLLSRGMLPVDQRTEVEVEVRDGHATNAWFSHNFVEVIAEGKVKL
jgi:hypothetical protein